MFRRRLRSGRSHADHDQTQQPTATSAAEADGPQPMQIDGGADDDDGRAGAPALQVRLHPSAAPVRAAGSGSNLKRKAALSPALAHAAASQSEQEEEEEDDEEYVEAERSAGAARRRTSALRRSKRRRGAAPSDEEEEEAQQPPARSANQRSTRRSTTPAAVAVSVSDESGSGAAAAAAAVSVVSPPRRRISPPVDELVCHEELGADEFTTPSSGSVVGSASASASVAASRMEMHADADAEAQAAATPLSAASSSCRSAVSAASSAASALRRYRAVASAVSFGAAPRAAAPASALAASSSNEQQHEFSCTPELASDGAELLTPPDSVPAQLQHAHQCSLHCEHNTAHRQRTRTAASASSAASSSQVSKRRRNKANSSSRSNRSASSAADHSSPASAASAAASSVASASASRGHSSRRAHRRAPTPLDEGDEDAEEDAEEEEEDAEEGLSSRAASSAVDELEEQEEDLPEDHSDDDGLYDLDEEGDSSSGNHSHLRSPLRHRGSSRCDGVSGGLGSSPEIRVAARASYEWDSDEDAPASDDDEEEEEEEAEAELEDEDEEDDGSSSRAKHSFISDSGSSASLSSSSSSASEHSSSSDDSSFGWSSSGASCSSASSASSGSEDGYDQVVEPDGLPDDDEDESDSSFNGSSDEEEEEEEDEDGEEDGCEFAASASPAGSSSSFASSSAASSSSDAISAPPSTASSKSKGKNQRQRQRSRTSAVASATRTGGSSSGDSTAEDAVVSKQKQPVLAAALPPPQPPMRDLSLARPKAKEGASAAAPAPPRAPKKRLDRHGLPPLSPFPLVPPVLLSHSPRHVATPYPSFDDLTSFKRSLSTGTIGCTGAAAAAAASAATQDDCSAAAAATSAASVAPAGSAAGADPADPYSVLDPSLPLSRLFDLAKSIPYNFSTVHSASKGWAFQSWNKYAALCNRQRRLQAQRQDRAREVESERAEVQSRAQRRGNKVSKRLSLDVEDRSVAAASSASILASSPLRPGRPSSPCESDPAAAACSDRYEKGVADLAREVAATIRTPSEHASLVQAALARGEAPPPPLAPSTPFDLFFHREWARSVPAELERVRAVYERFGMERGSAPLAELDLETPGGLAFRAVKYERSESQLIGLRQPSRATIDRRTTSAAGAAAAPATPSPAAAASASAPAAAGAAGAVAKPLPLPLRLHSSWFLSALLYLDLPSILSTRGTCKALHALLSSPGARHVYRGQMVLLTSMEQVTGWARRDPAPIDFEALYERQRREEEREEDEQEEEEGAGAGGQRNLSPPPMAATSRSRLASRAPRGRRARARAQYGPDREGRMHPTVESLESRELQLDATVSAAESEAALVPGEEWFLPESARQAMPWRWQRKHAGFRAGCMPHVGEMRFDEGVIWCPSLYTSVLHVYSASLHTLSICSSASLVNDVLLPAMLLGLEAVATEEDGVEGNVAAAAAAAAAAASSFLHDQDSIMSDAPAAASAGPASAAAAAASASSSPSPWRESIPSSGWRLTRQTRAALPALTSLTLFNCINFDLDGGLAFLPYYRPTLRHLHLGKCRGVGRGLLPDWLEQAGAAAVEQAQRQSTPSRPLAPVPVRLEDAPHNPLGSCTGLLSLHLSGCRDLQPVHVALLRPLSSLQVLDLSWCVAVDDTSLGQLARNNADLGVSLRSLYLQGCSGISDRGILAALPHLCALEVLDLSQLGLLGNTALVALERLPRLERLLLRFNPLLTDSCANSIARMHALSLVDLNFCTGISVHGRIAMKNRKQGKPLHFLTV